MIFAVGLGQGERLDVIHKALEEWRIFLRAAVVLRADIIQVCAIRECVLRNEIDIATIEIGVLFGLLRAWHKAVAKDHVSGAKTARISAAVEEGVSGHLGIKRLAIGPLERR